MQKISRAKAWSCQGEVRNDSSADPFIFCHFRKVFLPWLQLGSSLKMPTSHRISSRPTHQVYSGFMRFLEVSSNAGEPTPPLRPGVLNGARWTNLGGMWPMADPLPPKPGFSWFFPHTKCLKSVGKKHRI